VAEQERKAARAEQLRKDEDARRAAAAEQRGKIAERRRLAERQRKEKSLYAKYDATANILVSDVSEFIKANPRTKYLLDIITSVGGIKSALSAKSGSRLKDKLAELENLMAGIKPFGLFLESRAAKRQKAALRELAETKQLLNSEIDFLRQFVVQKFVSESDSKLYVS
jgi:hypothetical protein